MQRQVTFSSQTTHFDAHVSLFMTVWILPPLEYVFLSMAKVCELHRDIQLPPGLPVSFSLVEPGGWYSARDLILKNFLLIIKIQMTGWLSSTCL